MSLGWEKIKTPVVTLVGAFTPRNRVPTVPEKQVDRIRNEAKHRPQIYVGGKYKVNIRKRCKAAYREMKSPPCLGGVKRLVNSPSKDGSLLP